MTGGVTQQYMSVACGLHIPTVYSTHYPSYRAPQWLYKCTSISSGVNTEKGLHIGDTLNKSLKWVCIRQCTAHGNGGKHSLTDQQYTQCKNVNPCTAKHILYVSRLPTLFSCGDWWSISWITCTCTVSTIRHNNLHSVAMAVGVWAQ